MISFKKHLITGSLLVGSLAIPALGLADMAATPVATPTPLAWYQKVTVGGYLDEYYQLNFNEPTQNNNPSMGEPAGRAFDTTQNQFSFGGGELTLTQNDAASGTGYFADILMGPLAGDYSGDGSENGLEIGQAYLTQAFGNAKFTLGKFGTPVGYEVTYLPSNANFSRSLLFTQEPLYHVGLELAYTLPAGFVATGWIDNGNSINDAANAGKDYGLQLAYSGIKNVNLTGTWYLNNDELLSPGTATSEMYSIDWANFIATYTATDSLSFAGEYLLKDYSLLGNSYFDEGAGINYNPIQQGYALYATYSPIANLSISPRFEQWFNPNLDGDLGVGLSSISSPALSGIDYPAVLDDYTLTAKYQMGPLAHILEYRATASNAEIFTTANGSTKPAFESEIQQTLTYAAVYSF